MCFSSMLCKQEMFAFIRWFAAETEIFRIESPCRLVSMSWPHYDSLCKWLYLRRICVGLSTMVPQAFHLHFFAKQSCEGQLLYSFILFKVNLRVMNKFYLVFNHSRGFFFLNFFFSNIKDFKIKIFTVCIFRCTVMKHQPFHHNCA